jgi:hypothetical protein
MNTGLVKSNKFRKVASNVKPDAKKRIALSKLVVEEGVTYHVYSNELGQIVLDPQVSIPASEAWLFRDKESLEAVLEGLKQAAEGKIEKVDVKSL